jgi:hypothetical protein
VAKKAARTELFMNSATAVRFGMFTGTIWIAAIALFVLFGLLIGFKFSPVIFLFAIAVQLCVQGMTIKNEKK